MTLTTKFKIVDSLWFLRNDKIVEARIYKVVAHVSDSSEGVTYHTASVVNNSGYALEEGEFGVKFFLSKEELLKSL